MLAIQPSSSPKQITPNILPAKIHHNGPIPTPKRYWNPQPQSTSPNEQEVYFRGRKLLGQKIPLPEKYEGVVLQKTDKTLPVQKKDEDGDGEDEEDVEVKIMEQNGKFSEIVVLGHEVVPGEEDDYQKGIEEWVGFAEAIHAYDTPTNNTT
ncbi:hypothetical protein M409DRAFT_26975 [Zasmidium cellare ATCC 36951]|uniref:Uncharacterized protein n=1 Tax=Zasmidium cellare ATCC 36951 TaxID=1080233 RepID=A0A6A6C907_ZASCE|nr:uncharacterized protein M409DRAFT_26975 [Zasmidium cellare ATCC 36951]KAF2162738.1 hypothetical protein M409DRAFT_26975 [Zasmidium cellare ATCC 36951]